MFLDSVAPVSFIGLNIVRALSLITLILVFSSTIFVIVTNIKAVNYFDSQKNGTDSASLLECDYIEYVATHHYRPFFFLTLLLKW